MKIKKLLSLLLSGILLLSMTACTKEKADKYCSNCGNGVSKNASFCDMCGVEIGKVQEETASSTETATTITTQATTTTAKKTTTTTVHKHSYKQTVVAPSCTEKGYTIHKCACGNEYKDNYTSATHKYKKYVCSKCGKADKEGAYEHLKNWVKQNGTIDERNVGISTYADDYSILYSVNYVAVDDYVYVSILKMEDASTDIDDTFALVDLSNPNEGYTYYATLGSGVYKTSVQGTIAAENYTRQSPLTYDKFEGDDSVDRAIFMEFVREEVLGVLLYLDVFLSKNVPEMTMKSLGFSQL